MCGRREEVKNEYSNDGGANDLMRRQGFLPLNYYHGFASSLPLCIGGCMWLHAEPSDETNDMHYPNTLCSASIVRDVANASANNWMEWAKCVGPESFIKFPSFFVCAVFCWLAYGISRWHSPQFACTQFIRNCLARFLLPRVRLHSVWALWGRSGRHIDQYPSQQINTFLNYKFPISRPLIINNFPSVCADVFGVVDIDDEDDDDDDNDVRQWFIISFKCHRRWI